MNALLIKDGYVVNAIVVESIETIQADSPDFFASYDLITEASSEPNSPWIGWAYDSNGDPQFTPPAGS